MLLASDVLGINCLRNQTCALFYNYSSTYRIDQSSNSSFHFLSLSQELEQSTYASTESSIMIPCNFTCQNNSTCSSQWSGAKCEIPICSPSCENLEVCVLPGVCQCKYGWSGSYYLSVKTVLWAFDNTLNDTSSQFMGTGRYPPTYASGIDGYGLALPLNGTRNQCVVVNSYLNMSYLSFTWQFWIFPRISMTGDTMFIGQCAQAIRDRCLIIMTRTSVMWFAFWDNDVNGTKSIYANKWSHMTFIYDYAANQKLIYLDGVFEDFQTSKGALEANSTFMTFGCRTTNGGSAYTNFFIGYIDQVLYNSRVKNASEVLDDTTLVIHFRFLSTAPLTDSGPNHINGSWDGGAVSTPSRIVDQAIDLTLNGSYFLVAGLVLLGTNYKPFSPSFWFQTILFNVNTAITHSLV
ncbi:unnamed protein product [Adineta ricciae]|uniref:EGF-like domain-containing protein n=1 Tax=Adineta ricciae TaxID=249248 RepID=A0A814WC16_ADIRI|nr:unnamed protein product [Adineta ricciae]